MNPLECHVTPYFYPLFEHMIREHELTLIDSELYEIYLIANELKGKANDNS